jgi:DNA replication initiation complex subunit (GINS family)
MYDELYAAWRIEVDSSDLGILSSDFYERLADYMRRIREETKMIDKISLRSNLLRIEEENASRLIKELISTRHRKIAKMAIAGRKIPDDTLTKEELYLLGAIMPSTDAFVKFSEGVVQGKTAKMEIFVQMQEPEPAHTRITLRFIKPVPSIIGSDMKTYGPFMVEDVASVPIENARILVKQGLAKAVELQ